MTESNYSFKANFRDKISEVSQNFPQYKRFKPLVALLWGLDIFLRDNQQVIKSRQGVNYQLDTRDLIDFRLFYFGENESHIVKYLTNLIGSQKICLWDIGANVGSVCFPLITACPNLNIYAFEPSPPVFDRLKKNLNLNNLTRIHLNNFALNNYCGTVDFYPSSVLHNSGIGSLNKTDNGSQIPVKVDSYTGDYLIENNLIPQPSVIKIDVEGFEYEVFQGLESYFTKSDHISIIFEHEPYRFNQRKMASDQVIKLLESYGFKIYKLSQNKLSEFNPKHLKTKADFIAQK